MNAFVLDHVTLVRGLDGDAGATEWQRGEFSRFLRWAGEGGASLTVPALCLATVAQDNPKVLDHWLALVALFPHQALRVSGMARTEESDLIRDKFPLLEPPAQMAVLEAMTSELTLLTMTPETYAGVGSVEVVEL